MTQQTADKATPAAAAAAVVEPAAAPAAVAAAVVADETPITVTRSELNQIVADAVTAALAAKTTAVAVAEPAQRTDAVVDTQGKGDASAALVESVAKSVEGLASTMQTVVERLDSMAGSTTVRSDGKDSVVVARKEDVFAGVFSAGRKSQ